MATTLHIKRTPGGLIPADALSADRLEDLPMGKEIKAVCTVARSNKQNKWFHLVLRELFRNQDTWPTEKLFKDAVKSALGYADRFEINGKVYFEPKSIAFDKMDQVEFNQFVDRFIELVCTKILSGMTPEECKGMLRLLDADTGVLGERIPQQKAG